MNGTGQAGAASKFILKPIEDAHGPLPDASHRLDYWCKFDPPAFLKRYIRGEFCFCLKLRVWGDQVDSEDFCAFFSNFPAGGNPEPVDHDGRAGCLSGENDVFTDLRGGAGNQEHPVFIKIIELFDDVQKGIIRRGSFVRLYRRDQVPRGTGNALYRSVRNGVIEIFGVGADGKIVPGIDELPIFKHQRANEVIQAGTKLVKNLASDNGEAQRDNRGPLCDERILESVVLKLSDDLVWFGVAPQESAYLRVEIADVLFGPLNLGIASIQ